MGNQEAIHSNLLILLKEFDRICKQNEINYFLCFGSLIGAIRHNGFIPWDDDVDIVMTRDNYEKFLLVNFDKNSEYDILSMYNDKNYTYGFAKFVGKTMFCNSAEHKLLRFKYQTLWIDVFPMDYCNGDTKESKKWFRKIQNLYKALSLKKHKGKTVKAKFVRLFCFFLPKSLLLKIIRKTETKFSKKEHYFSITSDVTNTPFCKMLFNVDDWSECIYHKFENIELPIPVGYDSILKTIYGDYMVPPLEVNRQNHGL